MVTITDLDFSYGVSESVYERFNLSLNDSKIKVLLGHNGAGKTTLMKLLVNELEAQSGEIVFDSEIVSKASDIYYLPERDGCYLNLSIEDNIKFFASCSQTEDMAEIVDVLRLRSKLGTKVKRLSQGWKKRVAVANALAVDARLLLFDEPTNGIDPETKDILVRYIKTFASRDKYFIISTHDLQFALEIADHLTILNKGKVVWECDNPSLALEDLKRIYLEYAGEEKIYEAS